MANAKTVRERRAAVADAREALLSVDGLVVQLADGTPLVRELSFSVARGETLAIVGESGCGKSMTSLAVMGLLPEGIAIAAGEVRFEGRDLARIGEARLRELRGNRMAMIFQEPMSSLNPVLRVGEQVTEVIHAHEKVSASAARARAVSLLERVRIPEPARRLSAYPHQLSGGQRQRVMIAAALACGPDLLIADEPTTALDVTTQAEIMRLLRELQDETGLAMLWISHDLGVVGQMADRVMVMYAGRRVEYGPAERVLKHPRHPYTRLLMAARPGAGKARGERLAEIPGIVPSPRELPRGCAFAPRCPKAAMQCREATPPDIEVAPGQYSACVFPHAD